LFCGKINYHDNNNRKTESQENPKLIYQPMIRHEILENTEILRINQDEEYTIIDFIYHAGSEYIYGGWCQIGGDTFIKPWVVHPLHYN
jgi:hypothetical protein